MSLKMYGVQSIHHDIHAHDERTKLLSFFNISLILPLYILCSVKLKTHQLISDYRVKMLNNISLC